VRILFDHCTPWPFRQFLPGHEIRTAYQMGWADKDNGDLLRAAESNFDLFIATDRSIRHQQNLANRRIAILLIPQVAETVRLHRQSSWIQ
jgi:hypothetical protein